MVETTYDRSQGNVAIRTRAASPHPRTVDHRESPEEVACRSSWFDRRLTAQERCARKDRESKVESAITVRHLSLSRLSTKLKNHLGVLVPGLQVCLAHHPATRVRG